MTLVLPRNCYSHKCYFPPSLVSICARISRVLQILCFREVLGEGRLYMAKRQYLQCDQLLTKLSFFQNML